MSSLVAAQNQTSTQVANSNIEEINTIRPRSVPLTLDHGAMDSMVRLAEIMATGKATVPQEYRNNPGDCLAVVMQAVQWRMNPYAVAQKTHFVSGKIGYEAQLINAVITSLAPTEDRIHYDWYGPWEKVIGKFEIRKGEKGEYRIPGWKLEDETGIGIRVWATIKGEDAPRELNLLLAQARTRNSTLWADDPRQQLAYLAVKRWARLYTPDVIMGVYSQDELEEIQPAGERNMGAAEVVREKLGHVKPKTLADVMAMIAKAETPDAMEAARVEVARLESKDERAEGGNAWKARLAKLKGGNKPATVDKDTGEISTEQGAQIDGEAKREPDPGAGAQAASEGAPKVDYETLLNRLQSGSSLDVLDADAGLIGAIEDPDRQNTLSKAYQKRRKELTK